MVTAAPPSTGVLARVTAYAEAVLSGDILAGRPVRLACERHLRDVELGSLRGLWFDEYAANRAIRFMEMLKHSKGEWAGQPFRLGEWQIFIVGSVYGWKLPDGRRRFRIVHEEEARKNGKTTKNAGVALNGMVNDDEPGAEVYSAATKRDQARLCWDEAVRMSRSTPYLARTIVHSKSSLNLSYEPTNSKYEPVGRDADTLDGLNPSTIIVDELHAHTSREMVDVLETAVGARRQPLIWYITTAGFNQNSVWWQKRQYALSVLEGTVEDDSLFVYIATLDDGDDWRDPSVWIKANPNLGVSVYVDGLMSECKVAIEQPEQLPSFLTKRMNVPTTGVSRWIDMREWDVCDIATHVRPGDVGYCGIDLASTVDLSAAVLVFPPRRDDCWDVVAKFWRPEDTLAEAEKRDRAPYDRWAQQQFLTLVEGTMMDPADIADDVVRWTADYHVAEYPFDGWNAASVAARLEGAGLVPVKMAQGYATYSEACHALTGLLKSGKIRFGGNPILRWMAGQVMVETGPNDAIRPYKPKGSGIRDDGITALLMALARALVHRDAPPPPQPSVLVLDLWS